MHNVTISKFIHKLKRDKYLLKLNRIFAKESILLPQGKALSSKDKKNAEDDGAYVPDFSKREECLKHSEHHEDLFVPYEQGIEHETSR